MCDELIEKFIASKSGMCENSKAIYRYYLKKAFNTIGKCVNDITADDLRHYIFEMGKSYDVIHRERSVLGGFFSYLYKNGVVRKNPVDALKVPKSKKPEKKEKPEPVGPWYVHNPNCKKCMYSNDVRTWPSFGACNYFLITGELRSVKYKVSECPGFPGKRLIPRKTKRFLL